MIKIDNINPLRKPGDVDKKRKAGGVTDSTFASMLDAAEESEAPAKAAPVMAASPLGTMLALQEVSDEDVRRQNMMKQGKMSLDALEGLRDALLTGNLTAKHVERLQAVVDKQRELIDDPRLNAILDDIELRAAVELAKIQRAQGLF